MKFCSTCGAELFDNAVVCVKCGCTVQDQPKNIGATNPSYPSRPSIETKEPAVLAAFNFISTLFLSLTVFFLFTSAFHADFWSSSSYRYRTPEVYMRLDFVSSITALLSSFGAFATGLVTFIISLSTRQKGSLLFRGICKFIFGIMAVVLAGIAMSFA